MNGLHLTADLHGCSPHAAPMTDAAALRTLCLNAVQAAGLQAVGELFHRFAPALAAGAANAATHAANSAPVGITGVVLLAESHLAVHTWPELGAVTLDVYVCNVGADHSAAAQGLLDALAAAFAPQRVERHALQRGALGMAPRLPRTPPLQQAAG